MIMKSARKQLPQLEKLTQTNYFFSSLFVDQAMANIITARLSRTDAQPWGFRLQGGKDFGTPLVIQKVSEKQISFAQSVRS